MRDLRPWALAALRVTLGWLMVVWGADKLANPDHGIAVASAFYGGLPLSRAAMPALGIGQIVLGLAVVVGAGVRVAYPALTLLTGVTLLGVWRSIVDPWGWWLQGANALFYPSAIIFAGALVVWAFQDEDRFRVGWGGGWRGVAERRCEWRSTPRPSLAPLPDSRPHHAVGRLGGSMFDRVRHDSPGIPLRKAPRWPSSKA